MEACSETNDARWSKVAVSVPIEREMYDRTRREHPDLFVSAERQLQDIALTSETATCEDSVEGCFGLRPGDLDVLCIGADGQLTLEAEQCAGFMFTEGGLLQAPSSYAGVRCLDRMSDDSDQTWGFFPCHGGLTQQFAKQEDGRYCSPEGSECLVVI